MGFAWFERASSTTGYIYIYVYCFSPRLKQMEEMAIRLHGCKGNLKDTKHWPNCGVKPAKPMMKVSYSGIPCFRFVNQMNVTQYHGFSCALQSGK